jgi:hypothetical protein
MTMMTMARRKMGKARMTSITAIISLGTAAK